MLYQEVNGNLFDAPQGYCLAHCIAGDFGMGAGIATQFNEIFDMKNRLQKRYGEVQSPNCIKVDNVFNLITKDISWGRPTYDSLSETLVRMRDMMVLDGNKKLAIPQIGCGLDGLKWSVVRALIKDTFENTDIDITVYIYEPKEELDLNGFYEGQLTFDDYCFTDRATSYDETYNDRIAFDYQQHL